MQTKPAYLGAFPESSTSVVCECVRVCVSIRKYTKSQSKYVVATLLLGILVSQYIYILRECYAAIYILGHTVFQLKIQMIK